MFEIQALDFNLWYIDTYPYVLVVICGLLEIITTCSEVVTDKIYVKPNTKNIYFSIMYQITTFLQAVTSATKLIFNLNKILI